MDMTEEEYIEHIGIKRKSGRYPWGSGDTPYQRSQDFKSYLSDMKSQGLTDTQIADGIQAYGRQFDPHAKFNTSDLRAAVSLSTEEIYAQNQSRATYLRNERQMSTSAVARQMGVNESTVRGWLKASETVKEGSLKSTADALKAQVETKEFLDVGKGEHLYMGVTATKMKTALSRLQDEGYMVHPVKIRQLGTDKMTNTLVLTKPGVTWKEARDAVNRGELRVVTAQSDDGGVTFRTPKDLPTSINSKRIGVRYREEGGAAMDGVIELRRGVADLDLGASRYGQVRIAVDGTHYLKGMAMYADDLPAGTDIRFNTNKSNSGNKLDAMKPMKTIDGKVDPDGPFGATTHPKVYVGKDGKEHTSALNIVGSKGSGNVEGRWDGWSRSLSSQMLSKQPISLASQQLGKARVAKQEDLDRIMSLTNPVVKRKLLEEYAQSADAAAVHLKAAALPRQSTHVILPMNSMRPNEIYAPNFDNGERVALVRHPHGGPFEIPDLVVNNKNAVAKRILGDARDAVGIHHTVADQLSGADFDGDTVLVIPNSTGKVKSRRPLAQLEGFDAKVAYKIPDGDTTTPRLTKKSTQPEMGKISNLITDMSIHKASDDEIARAVKHSMVVIDAEKHGLDYKRSERENAIAELKAKYQGGANRGASTLISKAGADVRIPAVRLRNAKEGGPVDPKTGELVYVRTGATYTKTVSKTSKRTGETTTTEVTVPKTTRGARMEFTKDARELSSGTPMEEVYAAHANSMKSLANEARKASVALQMPRQSQAAKAVYSTEVKSLDQKLKLAQRNAPLERRAQVLGNAMAKSRIDANPGLDKDDVKKIKYQSLEEGRRITDAAKTKVHISDREWEAIQAGAVAHSRLAEILTHADMDRVKELATPRRRSSLSPGQMARARQLVSLGRPMSQIAEELGIPRSTIIDNLNAG